MAKIKIGKKWVSVSSKLNVLEIDVKLVGDDAINFLCRLVEFRRAQGKDITWSTSETSGIVKDFLRSLNRYGQ